MKRTRVRCALTICARYRFGGGDGGDGFFEFPVAFGRSPGRVEPFGGGRQTGRLKGFGAATNGGVGCKNTNRNGGVFFVCVCIQKLEEEEGKELIDRLADVQRMKRSRLTCVLLLFRREKKNRHRIKERKKKKKCPVHYATTIIRTSRAKPWPLSLSHTCVCLFYNERIKKTGEY